MRLAAVPGFEYIARVSDDGGEDGRAALEASIRADVELGALAPATTAALRLYGGELHAYLRTTAANDDLAAEAFADLCEDLWRGLPSFRWRSSLRSWLYALARNALGKLRRDPRRRDAHHVALSQAPEVAAFVRTMTVEFQKTEVKAAFRALREQLAADEYELLILRIDRRMSWKDIARILATEPLDGSRELTARAAALRKQFERAKQRLRKLAREHGLVGSAPDD